MVSAARNSPSTSSLITLAGKFPGDTEKKERVQSFYDLLHNNESNLTITFLLDELVEILQDLPHPARVQVLVNVVSKSSKWSDDLIWALYCWAHIRPAAGAGDASRDNDDTASVSTTGTLIDWEFIQAATTTSAVGGNSNADSSDGVIEMDGMFLNGQRMFVVSALVAAAPDFNGKLGCKLLKAYLSSPGQRFRVPFVKSMITNPQVPDDLIYPVLEQLPLQTLPRMLKFIDKRCRALRQSLIEKIIKASILRGNSDDFLKYEPIVTLGSTSFLKECVDSERIAASNFTNWSYHSQFYEIVIETKLKSFGTKIFKRSKYMEFLITRCNKNDKELVQSILKFHLKYPSLSPSNPRDTQRNDKIEALLQENKITIEALKQSSEACAFSVSHLSKSISCDYLKQLTYDHLIVPNKTTTDSAEIGLSIENHALLDILFEVILPKCGIPKWLYWKASWLMDLIETGFETAPMSFVASLFLPTELLGDTKSSVSNTGPATISCAKRTFDLFVSIYKARMKCSSQHLEIGSLVKSWTSMHSRLTTQWFHKAFPLVSSESLVREWWLKWHTSTTLLQTDVIERFMQNSIPDLSSKISKEIVPPKKAVSVLGLIDLIHSKLIHSFDRLLQEIVYHDNNNGDRSIFWWNYGSGNNGAGLLDRALRKIFHDSLISPLRSSRINSTCCVFERAHMLRQKPYESRSISSDIWEGFYKICSGKYKDQDARIVRSDHERLIIASDFIWLFKEQHILANEHYGSPIVPPSQDDKRASSSTSYNWLKEWMDLVENQWSQVSIPNIDTRTPEYAWDPQSQSLQQTYGKSSLGYVFKMIGNNWTNKWANLLGDGENGDKLPEPLYVEMRRAVRMELARLQKRTADDSNYDDFFTNLFAILMPLPDKVATEQFLVDALTEILLKDPDKKQDRVFNAFMSTKGPTKLRRAVLKNWCEANTKRDEIIRKIFDRGNSSWFPISTPSVRKLYEERRSEDVTTRQSNYIEFLEESLNDSIDEFATSLKFVQRRIKNERGNLTFAIYHHLERTLNRWLHDALVHESSLQLAQDLGGTLKAILECDVERRDSVARNKFHRMSNEIIQQIVMFEGEVKEQARHLWINIAIEFKCILKIVESGVEGLGSFNWGTDWSAAWEVPAFISRQELPTLFGPVFNHVPKKMHTFFLRRLSDAWPTCPAASFAKPRMSPIDRVQTLVAAVDSVRAKHGIIDSCISLVDGRYLGSANLYEKIRLLFYTAAERWLEVPLLTQLLETISEALLEMDPSGPSLHFILSSKLFISLKKQFEYWYLSPELVHLCDALFKAAVARCRVQVKSHENDYGTLKEILKSKIEARREQPMRELLSGLPIPLPTRSCILNVEWISRGVQNCINLPKVDTADIMSELFRICNTSVIYLTEMRDLITQKRTDLMGLYLPKERQKNDEYTKLVFRGVFQRMLGINNEEEFTLNHFLSANATHLTGPQATALSKHLFNEALSISNDVNTRLSAVGSLAGFPSIGHEQYIELLSNLQEGNQAALLETLILRSFDHDESVFILSFLLRPETIEKFPHRVLASVMTRLPTQFRAEQFVALLSVLLKRKKTLSMTLHKSLLRLLFTCPSDDIASTLLWNEWKSELSDDVRVDLIRLVMRNLFPAEVDEQVKMLPETPLRLCSWNIVSDLASTASAVPIPVLRIFSRIRYEALPTAFRCQHGDSGFPTVKRLFHCPGATVDSQDEFDEALISVMSESSADDYCCRYAADIIRFQKLLKTASATLLKSPSTDETVEYIYYGYILYDKTFRLSPLFHGMPSDDGGGVAGSIDGSYEQLKIDISKQLHDEIIGSSGENKHPTSLSSKAESYIAYQRPFLFGAMTALKLSHSTDIHTKYGEGKDDDPIVLGFRNLYSPHLEYVMTSNAFTKASFVGNGDENAPFQRNAKRDRALCSLIGLLNGVQFASSLVHGIPEFEATVAKASQRLFSKQYIKMHLGLRQEADIMNQFSITE